MHISELYSIFKQHPLICTDTRKIEAGCIFFALKGPNFNANTFAGEALEKGAACVVIDEAAHRVDERCVLVDDVLTTFQELARHHRMQLEIPVIAIVGSNGKTTTKELISSVLGQHFNVWATPGNLNNHIGLPLTLLQLNASHNMAVIEMGANHIGENALLCGIACPNFGIVTNNGKDHLEGFGSMEGVAQSNSELYYYLLKHDGLAFVNANDEWLVRMASRLKKQYTYAANDGQKNAQADCVGIASELRPNIRFSIGDSPVEIRSHLSGDYNFDNIMAAVSMGVYFGMDEAKIRKGVEAYEPKNNRSQVIRKQDNTLYLDAYNANPSSMEAALRNFAAMPFDGKVAILGDMFELGQYAAEEHRNMIALCKQLPLETVILVGEEFAKQHTDTVFHSFRTAEDAIAFLQQQQLKHKHVFMKGSRGMKLERMAEVIS